MWSHAVSEFGPNLQGAIGDSKTKFCASLGPGDLGRPKNHSRSQCGRSRGRPLPCLLCPPLAGGLPDCMVPEGTAIAAWFGALDP